MITMPMRGNDDVDPRHAVRVFYVFDDLSRDLADGLARRFDRAAVEEHLARAMRGRDREEKRIAESDLVHPDCDVPPISGRGWGLLLRRLDARHYRAPL